MALKPRIQVEGEKELRSALRKLDAGLVKGLKPVHEAAAKVVEGPARSRYPSRTGRLAASVAARGTTTFGYVKAGSSAVPYAGAIEFGWPARGIEGVHAILEAMEAQEDAVVEVYRKGIDDLISNVGLE